MKRNDDGGIIRLLVIEDNPSDIRLVREMLADVGEPSFEITGAGLLREGLELLESGNFDAVLLDLGLPDASGLEGHESIKTAHPDIPVVILTGAGDEALGIQAIRGLASDYLMKDSINSDLLVRSVRYAMERARIEGDLRSSRMAALSLMEEAISLRTLAEQANRELLRENEERRRAEEALRQSETLLRTVTDNNPDPIFMKDRDCRLLFANPATFRLIGKTADEAIGKTDEEFYDNPADGRAIMENDWRVMDSGRVEVVEESISYPDGSMRFFISSKAPLFDAQGQVVGLVGVSHEISDRIKAEEQIREKNRELVMFNRAMVGRELRMVELKKEINELMERMGAEPRYRTDFD